MFNCGSWRQKLPRTVLQGGPSSLMLCLMSGRVQDVTRRLCDGLLPLIEELWRPACPLAQPAHSYKLPDFRRQALAPLGPPTRALLPS